MAIFKRNLAIVGIGPRGSYALECYILELAQRKILKNLHLLLFDSEGNYGHGPVYGLTQNDANWLNITDRIILIESRPEMTFEKIKIPSFPSYHKWIGEEFSSRSRSVDHYPKRAKLGLYLQKRFQSLVCPLIEENIVSLIQCKVKKVDTGGEYFSIECEDDQRFKKIDEILLTIGHQPTQDSPQIAEWKNIIDKEHHIKLYNSPYPLNTYLNDDLDYDSSIGIRGFGLAMIDIIRGIVSKVGTLELIDPKKRKYNYSTPINIKNLIVPFSLDGLPPVPKPLNQEIDNLYKPSEKEIASFEDSIGNRENQEKAKNINFLIDAFAPIAADAYLSLRPTNNREPIFKEGIIQVIKDWLYDEHIKHHTIISNELSPYSLMKKYVDIATGVQDVSLDYCIGEVWRHCQPSIYDTLSFNSCNNEVVASIVKLDERVKRYSFGPPVDSVQQIIALVDADVLNLDYVNNPTIELSKAGWELSKNANSIMVKTMINSVLDAPKIKIIDSPILKHLLANNIIRAVHDDLGIATDEYGYLSSKDNLNMPIAVLGRLAKGTIIGVDAILECYGKRPQSWASKAADYHELCVK